MSASMSALPLPRLVPNRPVKDCRMICGLARNAHSDDVVIIATPPHSDQVVIALKRRHGDDAVAGS